MHIANFYNFFSESRRKFVFTRNIAGLDIPFPKQRYYSNITNFFTFM